MIRPGLVRGVVGLALALLAAIPLASCGPSPYFALKDEDRDGRLVALKASLAEHRREAILVPTIGETGRGPAVRVALHPVGTPRSDRLVVLVHGAFSDHSAFRFLAGDLARDHELLLVDLPGCGMSDAPDPDLLDEDAYSPGDLAWRTFAALRSALAKRDDAPRMTVVGHSLGGTIALRAFADGRLRETFADVLSRVDGLVLISAVDPAVQRPDPTLLELAEVSLLRIFIAQQIGTLRDRASAATIAAFDDPADALRQEADKRVEVMRDGPRRRALQAMIRRAVPLDDRGRMRWNLIDEIQRGYADVRVPVLVVWGARDEVVPVSTGYKLAAELPRAQLVIMPNVKHSPFLERPEGTAELIRRFIAGGLPVALDGLERTAPDPPMEPLPAG